MVEFLFDIVNCNLQTYDYFQEQRLIMAPIFLVGAVIWDIQGSTTLCWCYMLALPRERVVLVQEGQVNKPSDVVPPLLVEQHVQWMPFPAGTATQGLSFILVWLTLSWEHPAILVIVEITLQRQTYNGKLRLNKSSSSHISEDVLISFEWKSRPKTTQVFIQCDCRANRSLETRVFETWM